MKKEKSEQNNSETSKRKIKVALFCIAAIVILYLGTNFLQGIDIFGKRNYYYAVFANSGGLQESNPVLLNGFKIGKVTKTTLINDNPVQICTEILITENISLPADSKIEVAPKDLLGGTVVNLILGTSTSYAHDGDTLGAYVVLPMTAGIDEMKNKLNNILSSVDTIGTSLKDVLAQQGGAQDLKNTLDNIEAATGHLNDLLANNKTKAGKLIANLEVFSNTLQQASPQLNTIIDNFDKISDSIAKANLTQVINNADKAISDIEQMVDKVNKGTGTMGQLMNNDSLYQNLEKTTASLNELIVDLKANPKKYINVTVFGKKEKKNK